MHPIILEPLYPGGVIDARGHMGWGWGVVRFFKVWNPTPPRTILATAGAYLDQVATSFAEYLCLYRASWLRLQQTSPEVSTYEDRQLYSTWQLSLDHIKQQSELSAKLLELWAYFDNQDLWFELL
jgi:hypothetical protein